MEFNMLKILCVLFILSLQVSWAQEGEQRFYYTGASECFVKRYRNKELEVVPDKIFRNIALLAKELRRNPQYKAFKVNGDIYITQKDCLKTKKSDDFDDLDNIAISDQSREEKSLEEVLREERRSAQQTTTSHSTFNRNKYYIEAGGGVSSVPDQSSVVPDYNILTAQNPVVLTFGDVEKSKYTAKKIISIGFGKKNSDHGFYAFKLRFSGGEKTDSFTVTNTTPQTANMDIKYTDSNVGIYTGYKYLFLLNSSFKPFLSGFIGGNFGTLKTNIPTEKFESTTLGLIGEGGFEYLFTGQFGFNFSLSYEYVGKKTWKVKGTEESSQAQGFESQMSYSNISGTTGLIFYW